MQLKLDEFLENLKFTDKNIFGENFSPLKSDTKCAVDALLYNGYLNKYGNIKKSKFNIISKRYLWQYIQFPFN